MQDKKINNGYCKYCQSKVRQSLPELNDSDLELWVNTDNTMLINNYVNQKETHIKINYCPMCGKKLRN